MTEVALREEGLLSALGVEHTPTSLTLPPDISYEDAETVGAFIGMVNDASNWWLGEWLIQAEMLHGDKIHQATELTRRSRNTLDNVASTCRRVPRENRNPKLSFSAHTEVKALEPKEQKRWLKIAEQEDLRTHELRERIRYDQAEQNGRVVLPPTVTVEEAARHVWFASRRAVGDTYLVPAEVMLTLKDALGE